MFMGKTSVGCGSLIAGLSLFALALALPGGVWAQGKDASDVYQEKCSVCHGGDGAGKTAKGKKLKVKDVRDTVGKMSADQMALVVKNGKEPDMDAYGKELNDEQIKTIVEYYRSLARK
jgi:mono/diheme cytochrome c family protein